MVLEGGLDNEKQRNEIKDILTKHGYRPVLVWVQTDLNAIKHRMRHKYNTIAEAKAAAGITEPTDTWAGWKAQGYEVIHGSKALFGADLIRGSRGDGAVYKARFFGASQVQAM